jgi:hypothetical protein
MLSWLSACLISATCLLSAARRGMTLEDVRQLVERHHSVELPGFSPYSAVQDLVARHQRPWPAAVTECAAAAHRQLLQLVMLHVGRTFDRFPRAADHIRWVGPGFGSHCRILFALCGGHAKLTAVVALDNCGTSHASSAEPYLTCDTAQSTSTKEHNLVCSSRVQFF